MKLVVSDNTGEKCPYCGCWLEVEATWECDPPPYPDATCECPKCGKDVRVEQRVVAELTKSS